MKRNRLAPIIIGFLLACTSMEGAIPLNSLQTFDSLPLAEDWATHSTGGGGSSILSPEDLDAAIQTNQVAAITNLLHETSGGTFGLAQWHLTGRYLQTRPGGVAYQVLLATIQNTSGKSLFSVTFAYDFGNPFPVPFAEDPGLNGVRAYYSLIGEAGSWLPIPELTTSQTGNVAAVIYTGAWPAGSLLYLMWVDDNGGAAADGAFTIDNFIALESLPPPPPPHVDPPATNIVCNQTIRLAAIVSGFGLHFQWFKDGQPIDAGMNPTAIQPVLIITNANSSDAGQYRVSVQNAAGGMISAIVPVQVDCGGDAPFFVFAYNTPDDPKGIRVIMDQELCFDGAICDAEFSFNWIVESVPSLEQRLIDFVAVNGTSVQFTLAEPRAPGETFRIRPADDGTGNSAISDPFGNRMLLWHSITSVPALLFKQGFNGYSGTQDAEIHSGSLSDSVLGAAQAINIDLDNVGIAQGLLRFGNLVGNGPNQMTPGVRIRSATLSLAQLDPGSQVNLRRLLVDWDQGTATWNSLVNGISADDTESRSSVDTVIVSGATESIDVTASVQAWVNGAANFGWFLESTGTDRFEFASSESAQPPGLTVILDPIEPPCILSSAQVPAAITVLEGQAFTLSPNLTFEGFCPLTYQWTKNGVNIEGARSSTFSVPAATGCDSGVYRVIVSVAGQSVTSNPVGVTISADVVPPVLTHAFGSADGTNIILTFSKVMNATNTPDVSHYVLDPPLAVTSATLSADGRTVTLATAPRSPLTSYTLRIQDVTDNRAACSIGNILWPNPTLVQLTGRRIDVPWNTEWLYSTNSQDATLSTPTPWYAPNFMPGPDWFTGQALFGTETSAAIVAQLPAPLITPIPPNSNSPPDQITTYFRKQIQLPPLSDGAGYALCHFIDDGAAFYLDGVKIGSVNLGEDIPLLFAQRATTIVEASLQCLPFDATPGAHLLAVEVHQAGATTSPDILFGVQVEALASVPRLNIRENQPLISWHADSYWELVTSTNVLGPFAPAVVNPSFPLGTYFGLATNDASFYRLRYKGTAK